MIVDRSRQKNVDIENIKKGYKITKETSSQKIKTFTLKNKKNEVVICVVYLGDHDTECWKP